MVKKKSIGKRPEYMEEDKVQFRITPQNEWTYKTMILASLRLLQMS